MSKPRLIHGLEPMLQALRIEQTVSFYECQALFAELFAATGGTPPVWELSGNQWCALVNLAVARHKTPNAGIHGPRSGPVE